MLVNIKMTRRRLLKLSGLATGTLVLPGFVSDSFAQKDTFPRKQMEALIGFSPGGGTDRSARVLTPSWEKGLGTNRPFKYTYAPGAASLIALRRMMEDPRPDGHVVHFTPIPHTAWIFVLEKPGFALEDIGWIGSYFSDPDVLLVQKKAKWDRIDQFIEDARKAKEPFTVSVSSPMSAAHAATVVLRELSGAKLKVVPFKGGSESRNAVAGGHVTACMAPYWSAIHVLELTKAIGIFADSNPAPNLWQPVPANQVLDFKMPDLYEPYAVQVHGAVRTKYPDRYKKLVTSMKEAYESKEFRALADKQDFTPFLKYMSPEECVQFIKDYLNMLAKFKPAMERDTKEMIK
jgi:tripartite-type tricarboxylate transporter receptor subunit TctC